MSPSFFDPKASSANVSAIQSAVVVVLRIAIGWHFLYEGFVKLLDPRWSSAAYLAESKWILSGFFSWILSNPTALKIVDYLNIWGLILIGLGLFFGCLTRMAAVSGIVLLSLYYVALPPLVGVTHTSRVEGNYIVVDKNLVELFALCVLAVFPAGTRFGLDGLFLYLRNRVKAAGVEQHSSNPAVQETEERQARPFLARREIIKSLAAIPFFGTFVYAVIRKRKWESFEERHLAAATGPQAITSATIKTFYFSRLGDLTGKLPYGQIRGLKLSRMILGGNLIGGWAHARDLIYVSKLVKAYHTNEKIFETFLLAEKCGINAFLTNPVLCRVINDYWRRNIGKIQFVSDCGGKDIMEGIRISIDNGACACYVHGGIADRLVKEGKVDQIGKALDLIRKSGLPAGIGGHSLDTIKACVDNGLTPDFWMKTLHHCNYWSAKPQEQNDNIWCTNPEETIEYMKNLEQPWITYKVLAAGAIEPKDGFQYAFRGGADFICVGMYDFQIVDDVNIALGVLSSDLKRERPWRA